MIRKTPGTWALKSMYHGVASIFKEDVLPVPLDPEAALDEGWSVFALEEARRNSRYLATGHGIRGIFYGLLFALAWTHKAATSSAWLTFFVFFHGVFLLLELGKANLFTRYIRFGRDTLPKYAVQKIEAECDQVGKPKAKPLRWESSSLYRRLGMDYLQDQLHKYTTWAKGPPPAETESTKPKYLGFRTDEMLAYTSETLTSEVVHAACAAANVFLIINLYLDNLEILAGICSFMLFFDLSMVLLQRYHRARIFEIVTTRENRRQTRVR